MGNDTDLIKLFADRIIASPEFSQVLDREIEQRISHIRRQPEYFTREQLATLWKVSKQTVDRMSEELLNEQGYKRKKIGVSVRFEVLQKR